MTTQAVLNEFLGSISHMPTENFEFNIYPGIDFGDVPVCANGPVVRKTYTVYAKQKGSPTSHKLFENLGPNVFKSHNFLAQIAGKLAKIERKEV
jgi:hypothetical protein